MSGVNWSAVVWLDVNKPDTLPKSVENSAFEAFCIMKSGHFVRKIMTYLKLFSVMSWVRYWLNGEHLYYTELRAARARCQTGRWVVPGVETG